MTELDLKKIASLADELSQLEIGGAASISLIPSDCKHRPPFFKAHLQYTGEILSAETRGFTWFDF